MLQILIKLSDMGNKVSKFLSVYMVSPQKISAPLQQLVWAQELPDVDPQPQGQLQPIGVHGHGPGQHKDHFFCYVKVMNLC